MTMADDEYRAFLEYLFNEYIRDRIPRLRRYWDHRRGDRWAYEQERLRRALNLLRYIDSHCYNPDEVYRTFRIDRIRRLIDEVEDSVSFHNRIADEAGFLDCFDSHFDEILAGLGVEYFPEGELDILRETGSLNPRSDLQGIVYMLKVRQKERRFSSENVRVSRQLDAVKDRLALEEKEFSDVSEEQEKDKPKKSRRWFKGLGQIGQGVALSIGNIALAIGGLDLPVSPETQTWGALVSATTGVGMVFTGFGELRGE